MTVTYDLSSLPMMISEYAFDGVIPRLRETNNADLITHIELDYDEQVVYFDKPDSGSPHYLQSLLQGQVDSAINSLNRMVDSGEITEFTVEELEEYREDIDVHVDMDY